MAERPFRVIEDVDDGEQFASLSDATPPPDDEPVVDSSLFPIDLGPVLAGGYRQPEPDVFRRDDGRCVFYRRSVNGMHGDSGTGKGWIVSAAIADTASCGGTSLYIDLEDNEQSIVARLRAVGMTDDEIVSRVLYVRPQVALGHLAVAHLCDLIADRAVDLLVIDSLGEAFALGGLNEDKDAEVGPWLRHVARPLAEAGPAVVLVDHSTKAGTNDLHASGSKRKRAAITGLSLLVEAVKPLVKGDGGRLRLTCAKDRHGTYRRGEVVADAVMAPSTTDRVHLTLYAPAVREPQHTIPIELAARAAVAAAKAEGNPLSQAALVGAMAARYKANNDTKRGGIDLAVARGALVETKGARNARLFTYAHDLPGGEQP